jgi:enoyl-CoA hydratase
MTLVNYELKDRIATITLDDGKANVLSSAMIAEIHAALDRAQADEAAVIITGREGRFSGGFDLKELTSSGEAAMALVKSGFLLAERLLTFPTPTIIASPGHAIAMGVFLMLSVDYRIGAAGAFKYQANEVAIGLPMPYSAIEMCRGRLTPTAFNRAIILAEVFSPDDALTAGFLDRVVPPEELMDAARAKASSFLALNDTAHKMSKERARERQLEALRAAIVQDFDE